MDASIPHIIRFQQIRHAELVVDIFQVAQLADRFVVVIIIDRVADRILVNVTVAEGQSGHGVDIGEKKPAFRRDQFHGTRCSGIAGAVEVVAPCFPAVGRIGEP